MEASKCSRCKLAGDKMCYQHIVSYLFPISKKNGSPNARKVEEKSADKLISAKIEEGHIDFDQEIERGKVEGKQSEVQGTSDGKELDLTKCISGVCENGTEKKRRKTIANRLLESLVVSEDDKNGVEESGVENPERIIEGDGEEGGMELSRKRQRKSTEKGAGFYRSLSGQAKKKQRKCMLDVEKRIEIGNAVAVFCEKGNGEEERVEKSTLSVCENGAEEKEGDSPSLVQQFGGKKKLKSNDQIHDETVGIKVNMNTCHQCHRNDKGRVVKCTKCNVKRYCIPCIKTWYPLMTEEQIAEACPICRENCNCKTCLSMEGPIKNRVKDGFTISQEVKVDYVKYLLRTILPFLEQIIQEQMTEKEIEAEIQGIPASELKLQNANFCEKERVFCNNCKDSIVDFHRSCRICKYNLCLACCREVRAGQMQDCGELIKKCVEKGSQYVYGKTAPVHKKSKKVKSTSAKQEGKPSCKSPHSQTESSGVKDGPTPSGKINGGNFPEFQLDGQNKAQPEWSADKSGAISCPPSNRKGCCGAFLELKSSLSDGWLAELLKKAEQTMATWGHENRPRNSEGCSCSVPYADCMRKCASRDGSNDNHLYCPDATTFQQGGLKHFQWHWTLGEPIIVRSVLKTAPGLSWEPMVIWRAFRQIGNKLLIVKAINCLDWSEVELNAHQFFKGYSVGQLDNAKRPVMLKLKDWPPNGKFEQRLPRHCTEFIRALPYKEYTHPRDGVLNLATKWPIKTSMPDVGPKTYIAYGRSQELGCGDSVTKLHCHMADVVNIMVHTTEVALHLGEGAHPSGSLEGSNPDSGGALWDIFRREDVVKLQEFLRGHYREFRYNHCSSRKKVIHPIHDQTFYLNVEHKRKLKAEYGIEPWTFVQNLGEAVLIPAGCPHQVRNLKSCIKVALDFLSPENVHESLRLTEELRHLPRNHKGKEDNLEVRKMIIHGVQQALNDLETKQEEY